MARRTGSSVSVISELTFTGSDADSATSPLLPSCDLHCFDVDGAVSIKMRIGNNDLKVVGTVTDGFLNVHLGGVEEIEVTETAGSAADVRIHSSRV